VALVAGKSRGKRLKVTDHKDNIIDIRLLEGFKSWRDPEGVSHSKGAGTTPSLTYECDSLRASKIDHIKPCSSASHKGQDREQGGGEVKLYAMLKGRLRDLHLSLECTSFSVSIVKLETEISLGRLDQGIPRGIVRGHTDLAEVCRLLAIGKRVGSK